MKKTMLLLMLVTSIRGNLFAQQKSSNEVFDLPVNKIHRNIFVDLGNGNKLRLELEDLADIDVMQNIDSVLKEFALEIEPLKDSLANELSTKRIDYVMDPSGKNKIRIQQTMPVGSTYISSPNGIAALKLTQDTLSIISRTIPGSNISSKNKKAAHIYRVSFIVNNLSDIRNYMDGQLQSRLQQVRQSANGKWVKGRDETMHVKSLPSVYATTPRGQAMVNDFLNLRLTADIQNYRDNFIPSLSIGFVVVTNRKSVRREFSLMSEYHFNFLKDNQGKIQTFRNNFLTIGYAQSNPPKEKTIAGFNLSFSLGYLLKQRGTIYEKNTFRLGFGRTTLFGETLKLEPVVYFHDFFKGITPGIRLSL